MVSEETMGEGCSPCWSGVHADARHDGSAVVEEERVRERVKCGGEASCAAECDAQCVDGQRPRAVHSNGGADGGGMEVEADRYCCGSTVRAVPGFWRARQVRTG